MSGGLRIRVVGSGCDGQHVAASPNSRAVRQDVQRATVIVGGKQPSRFVAGVVLVPDFFGQTDGRERASDAKTLVVGDRRPFHRGP
jgi:hypothetical protein